MIFHQICGNNAARSATSAPGLTEYYAVSPTLHNWMGVIHAGRSAARTKGCSMTDRQMPFPRLSSERLLLVSPADPDFDANAAFLDAVAPRFIDAAEDPDSLWWSIATIIGHWHLHGYGLFAVVERSSGQTVGLVGPWFPKGWPEPELSWHLMEPGRGKGYASEAAQCVLNWLFTEADWNSIVSYIPEGNDASVALARRIGAQPENTVSFRLQPAPNIRAWRHLPPAGRHVVPTTSAVRGLLH